MVNKAMVAVLAAIVLVALAVGVMMGLQLSDEPPAGTDPTTPAPTTSAGPTTTTTTGGGTTTTTTTAATATTTETATTTTETTTSATTATTTPGVSPSTVNASHVERAVRAEVNRLRERNGREPLAWLPELREMARFHSENMAGQGYPSHVAAGYTTEERYREFELYERCKLADSTGSSVRTGEELEVVGRLTPSTIDASTIGRQMVQQWAGESESRERLLYRSGDRVGVGVTVTEAGQVYVTLDLC
jgi:uncharacterized protein YkwD